MQRRYAGLPTGKVRALLCANDGKQPMHKMIEFLAVVVVCTVIGVACEQYDVNRYLKWLLMALPAIVWVRLRNPFLR
jgi:hypothetical protein